MGRDLLVGQEIRLEELVERLAFSEEQTQQAVLEQAKLFMLAAGFRVRKMRERQRAEMDLDEIKATLSLLWRKKKNANQNAKRQFTERYLSDLLDSSPKVRAAKEVMQKAEQLEEYAKLLIEAYRQRRDALKILTNFLWMEEGLRLSSGMGQEKRMKRVRENLRDKFPDDGEE